MRNQALHKSRFYEIGTYEEFTSGVVSNKKETKTPCTKFPKNWKKKKTHKNQPTNLYIFQYCKHYNKLSSIWHNIKQI